MKSYEIRQKFLDFFKNRAHAVIPSASLVPENDPSVLFNTAGMQPLVPYLMGQPHPLGNRIASCQKCVRTGDLDDIGDNRHFSFFEMLGNWSLGDYFKEEAIKWSYEFLTDSVEGLGLKPERLAVTIFEGDENAPYDQESKDIWIKMGIPEHRIYALPADDNWWSPGDNGPCGPCSEMFYDMQGKYIGQEISHAEFLKLIDEEEFIEIWNDVFMEYEKKNAKVIGKLAQKNVDTGAGLERITAVMQGKNTAYDTDILEPTMNIIKIMADDKYNEQSARVVCDHIRTAAMMISDGVTPAAKDQGYILRRLIRRALMRMRGLIGSFNHAPTRSIVNTTDAGTSIEFNFNEHSVFDQIIKSILQTYSNTEYLSAGYSEISHVIYGEEIKFRKGLESGFAEIEKGNIDPFDLYTTHGFPVELTEEIALGKGIKIDREKFELQMREHQDLSRAGSEQKFKGGLADNSESVVKLHTAHHLLLAALQKVLGSHVHQKGSNITGERLRIDFSHGEKMTSEQLAQVTDLVNTWIREALPMTRAEMPRTEAENIGAEMEFGAKYPDVVSVYYIGHNLDDAISKEFCGGPHVSNTDELGEFKVLKEEASSAGVRRIKAVLI